MLGERGVQGTRVQFDQLFEALDDAVREPEARVQPRFCAARRVSGARLLILDSIVKLRSVILNSTNISVWEAFLVYGERPFAERLCWNGL